jgi:hypothetical protein
MNQIKALILLGALLSGMAGAQTPPSLRVRGAVTGFDGHVLQVFTRDNTALKIDITDQTRINELYAQKFSDIKQDSFVGITAIRHGPRTPLQAREVHIFTEAQRGTGEGHYDWDLEPGSSMTNANVNAIVDTNDGKLLTLSYRGGSQKIIVTKDIPIVAFKPADKSLLIKGAQIFCVTEPRPDGSLSARYISVGSNGLKPPM